MTGFIIRRTLSMLVTFVVVSIVIFLMMHSITGGPFDGNEMPLPDNIRARLMAQLGLDQPLYVQYLKYMWGVLHFDFGVPYQSPGETVIGLVAHAWLPSLVLGGSGLLIGAPLGILLGMAAALNRNSWIDYLASALATLGLTVPVFVISTLLILVFAATLNWLPASGWGEPKRWILPILAYAAVPLATYARYARAAMLDVLNKPFVTVLRAKGLSERRIVFQHVLRNSAIPMVVIFLPMFVGIATGTIFVEEIFRVPGLGAYFVSSIDKRDYPLEMALMLLISMLFCISYLISDILYALLNPRIRIDGGRAMTEVSTGGIVLAKPDTPKQRSPLYFAWRRFAANKAALGGGAVLIILILMAIFAPFFLSDGPNDQVFLTSMLSPPAAGHWFGIDNLGRDLFTRIVYGARVSLGIGFSAAFFSLVIGLPLGALAGYLGGRFDWITMRVVELFSVVPPLLAALLLATVTRGGVWPIILIAALFGWKDVCILVRAQVKSFREKEFIMAAQALGASPWHIIFRHLIPNAVSPVIVGFVLAIPLAMMLEASLSFLGIGVQPPTPSWGYMINDGINFMFGYWHMEVFPTAALAITILAASLLGDGLRDAFDPTLKGR